LYYTDYKVDFHLCEGISEYGRLFTLLQNAPEASKQPLIVAISQIST